MEIKRVSISDVITNSSTEIYTFFDYNSLEKIKNIATTLMSIAREDINFDDIFNIKLTISDWKKEDLLERYKEENPDHVGTPSEDELLDFALSVDEYSDDPPFVDGYSITIKPGFESEKIKKVRDVLSGLEEMFDQRAIYS